MISSLGVRSVVCVSSRGNDHYNAHFVLFPKIDARLRLGSAFGLRLETDASLCVTACVLSPRVALYRCRGVRWTL